MVRSLLVAILGCVLLGSALLVEARPFRPKRIPNGKINKCLTCHVSPKGGGKRNVFGKQVDDLLGKKQEDFWGPELAKKDSDGDGFTNGQELQDPDGKWKFGDPQPGDRKMVSNPGDKQSVPPGAKKAEPVPQAVAPEPARKE